MTAAPTLALFAAPSRAPRPEATKDPVGRLEVWLRDHLAHGRLVLTSDSFGLECWSGVLDRAWAVTVTCPCRAESVAHLANQESALDYVRAALCLGNP